MQRENGSFLDRIRRINHFWLRKGEVRKIVFLEDVPSSSIRLHTIPIINRFKKLQYLLVPCMAGKMMALDCPFCKEAGENKLYSSNYKIVTIFDYTPYVNQKGEKIPSGKKVLCMRRGFLEREISKIKGTKQYAGFNAKRSETDEDSLGSNWEFLGYMDISKMYPDQIEPYDLSVIFAPPSSEDVTEIFELNKMARSVIATNRKGGTRGIVEPTVAKPPVVETGGNSDDPEPYF